jgi:hypothetical protein
VAVSRRGIGAVLLSPVRSSAMFWCWASSDRKRLRYSGQAVAHSLVVEQACGVPRDSLTAGTPTPELSPHGPKVTVIGECHRRAQWRDASQHDGEVGRLALGPRSRYPCPR